MAIDGALHHRVPRDLFERRSWIRHQLRLRHSSLAEIARRAGVSRQAVTAAISMPQSCRITGLVAETIEIPPEELFPEIFLPSGQPRRADKQPTQHPRRGRVESAERA